MGISKRGESWNGGHTCIYFYPRITDTITHMVDEQTSPETHMYACSGGTKRVVETRETGVGVG